MPTFEYWVQMVDDGEVGPHCSGTIELSDPSEERAAESVIELMADRGWPAQCIRSVVVGRVEE